MSDMKYRIVLDGIDEVMRCIICQNPMHTDRGCDGNCQYNEAMYKRIIQELDSRIKRLPYDQLEPHWIPCSERLPEKEGLYLVTEIYKYSDGRKEYETDVDRWSRNGLGKEWSMRSNDMILAWMPLPEPYKGVTE